MAGPKTGEAVKAAREELRRREQEDLAKSRPKLKILRNPWIPGVFLGIFLTMFILNQMGFISIFNFQNLNANNANSNSNSNPNVWTFPDAAVIGTSWSYDFNRQLTPLLDPEGTNGPYTYYLGSGTGFPPMGLILNPNGVLSGTPTGTGGDFQVCVKDVSGKSTCRTYHLNVNTASTPASTGGQAGTTPSNGCPTTSCDSSGDCCWSKTWDAGLGTYSETYAIYVAGSCNCPAGTTFSQMVGSMKYCTCNKA